MGLEPNREGSLGGLGGLQVLDFIDINALLHPVMPRILPRILPQYALVFYKTQHCCCQCSFEQVQ